MDAKGHHKYVENNSGTANIFSRKRKARSWGFGVLLLRRNIEDEHQPKPDNEINDRARVKRWW